MKKLLLILPIFLISILAYSQISILPSKGDRFSFCLNGDVWETKITIKSKFVLKVFISLEGEKHIWIQNLSLKENELIALMKYIDLLPNINVGAKTKSTNIGSRDWKLDSFHIHGGDYYEKPVGEDIPPDLFYLRKKIKEYYKKPKL